MQRLLTASTIAMPHVPTLMTEHGLTDVQFLPPMWQQELFMRVESAKAHHLRLHQVSLFFLLFCLFVCFNLL
jgi:hypothetical protein